MSNNLTPKQFIKALSEHQLSAQVDAEILTVVDTSQKSKSGTGSYYQTWQLNEARRHGFEYLSEAGVERIVQYWGRRRQMRNSPGYTGL